MGTLHQVTSVMGVGMDRVNAALYNGGGGGSPFLLTNGVQGDGTHRLQMLNVADDTAFTHPVPNEWTFENWIKIPSTTVVNSSGALSSNPTSTAVNLFSFYYALSNVGAVNLAFILFGTTGSEIITIPTNYMVKQGSVIRDNLHVVIRVSYSAPTYTYSLFINGKLLGTDTTTSKPGSFGFNYCTDRSLNYSRTSFMGSRWTDVALSDAEVVATYNEGKWTEPQYPASVVFDQRWDNRTGDDFVDNSDTSIKVTAISYANIENNLFTPSIFETPKAMVVFDGNSLTTAQGTPGNYPNLTFGNIDFDALGLYVYGFNFGVGATFTAGMISRFPTRGAVVADADNLKQIAILWEGTNDMYNGISPEDSYASMVTLIGLYKDAGYTVAVMTTLPTGLAGFNANRNIYNGLLRDNAASLGITIIDVAANTTIGEDGDEANTTYYQNDQIHLKAAGYTIVAGVVAPELQTLLS